MNTHEAHIAQSFPLLKIIITLELVGSGLFNTWLPSYAPQGCNYITFFINFCTVYLHTPHHTRRRSHTEVVGSPYWMAPECLCGQSYCEQADVFSFGITLAEIMARVPADPEYMPRTKVRERKREGEGDGEGGRGREGRERRRESILYPISIN